MYLNCHTTFSLRYGTLSVDDLIEQARLHGVERLALTDVNNTSAVLDFVRKARKAGIEPVAGIEFRNDNRLCYIGLARNQRGFQHLNVFLSQHLHGKSDFPARAPELEDVHFVYPFENCPKAYEIREDEWVGLRQSQVNALYTSPYRNRTDRLVMLHPVTFQHKAGYNLHRLLRSIDRNIVLSKQDPTDVCGQEERMLPLDLLLRPYRDYPVVISNTVRLLDTCSFDLDLDSNKNKQHFTASRYDDRILLEKLAHEGMRNRYGPNDGVARERVQRELDIIDRLGFSAYFLITWDFIRYGQSRGFFHVGRGSGANSIVAYCMGITDVDPIGLDLYFERFLNPYRTSPPDFDIDFSWQDRDEVLDYVYKRYGQGHTALIATYNTFKGRSILRELGKVFGLPKNEIDHLVANRHHPDTPDNITQLIYKYARLLNGLPNHLGIHPGGILISEEPIHAYSATEVPPKGFPIVQFDMFVAEECGLYKYDILSQRGLGHIKDAAIEVRSNQRRQVDVHAIQDFKRDPKIRQLLQEGRTIGCFYVESPAMRQLLQKLRCETYIELVAASSIIRPGVARSGMMRAYIERSHAPEKIEYLHPRMAELLEETYGVMVYQEDVIKVAHHFAGLDLGEADVLRRAMSGKYRGSHHFEQIRDKFFANCRERGYPDAIAQEVWRQIESFSGYSFSKAHSASFAVESYQSLYLKAHFPREFMVGVINNFGGFYRTEIYVHEARRAGANILAPCVNHSQHLTSIRDKDIWLGFVHVKDLETKLVERLLLERARNGAYLNMEDLVRRVDPGLEQLSLLVRVGALRFTGSSKKALLWDAHLRYAQEPKQKQKTVLFQPDTGGFHLPVLANNWLEDAYDEMELLGFPLCSPFAMLSEAPPADQVFARDLPQYFGREVVIRGYYVCIKPVKTVNGKMMAFAAWLDEKGDFFDTTHFPDVWARDYVAGVGVYELRGLVADDFGVPSVEVSSARRVGVLADPRRE